ncbi:putative toxin-antitoxin system toxin component, PIN family [Paenisporosarcina sp. TG20]|uniref:putative toxin-antitoxin system toxin component, PIN family n=1 Tax=Paenisporosarcina sp. TG20 TaxID=1211706 RepID=UPI0003742705|nr:putative toxin-antitoxin system toxin component, PIN family [Paenisporosarcina sp. TG20]
MRNKPRVVIDTNIFIEGLLDEIDSSKRIIELFDDIKLTLLFSQDTIGELVYMMKIMAKKNIRDLDKRIEFLNYIINVFYHSSSINTVDTDNSLPVKCNDSHDDMFLECAYFGNADYLISNDIASGMHKLVLGKVSILTSEEFIEQYDKNE